MTSRTGVRGTTVCLVCDNCGFDDNTDAEAESGTVYVECPECGAAYQWDESHDYND